VSDAGTVTAGYAGAILIRWWDAKGRRWRITVGYAGEGVAPNEPHKVDDDGGLVHAASGEAVPDPLGDLRAHIQGGGRITLRAGARSALAEFLRVHR